MKGFIRNEGKEVSFKLQKHVVPGGTLTFDHAYKLVGSKSELPNNLAFLKWLKKSYFPEACWKFYKDTGEVLNVGKSAASKPLSETSGRVLRRPDKQKKGSMVTADSIISKPIAEAKVLIEKCNDKRALRRALSMSRHFSGKEEHTRILMRRLEQVY